MENEEKIVDPLFGRTVDDPAKLEMAPGWRELTIDVPTSLLEWVERVAANERISVEGLCIRIIQGLRGITKADLAFLREPPKGKKRHTLMVAANRECLDLLYKTSGRSHRAISSTFRRLCFALFVTGGVRFVECPNDGGFVLELTQLRFGFAGGVQASMNSDGFKIWRNPANADEGPKYMGEFYPPEGQVCFFASDLLELGFPAGSYTVRTPRIIRNSHAVPPWQRIVVR